MKVENKGAWLPVDRNTAKKHMDTLRKKIKEKKQRCRLDSVTYDFTHDVIKDFRDLIDNDAVVRMNFTKMIDQVPAYYSEVDENGEYLHGYYLTSIDEMLEMIDSILDTAPEYNETDLVGFPINTILNWTMGVPAGAAAFRNEKVNAMFKRILDVWTEYLDSPDSTYVFNDGPNGWQNPSALAQLNMDQYLDDPTPPWPYNSWNEFFIRPFKDSEPPQRPICQPANQDETVIVSACDSNVYSIQSNVKFQDWFWIKSQPYSLWDMLANEDGSTRLENNAHFEQYVTPFQDGTVFQAFLSAFKYHRWHSPVSGKILKAYVKSGTYYSATQSEGLDQASPDLSQGYIAHTAARAIIFIQAEEPIGLMCCIFIGMAEVSSCIIENEAGEPITPGYTIQKGEQLGYFQFGGSTHCLVFRQDVVDQFTDKEGNEIVVGDEIFVNQCIARINV